jgi:uroporphyrin-III C-methyltransferase/precorrin-2 dehydrogenase/sirohydrochlorin ferrochelatase
MPEPYPLFLNLESRLCVVVGGGGVALGKVWGLLAAGARVRVVAPEAAPELRVLADEGAIELIGRAYREGDLAGGTLAVVATDDPRVSAQAAGEARAAGVLVNVADAPALCDWIAPSVARRGGVTVAVSTGGRSPSFARRLRERIEQEVLTPEVAGLLDVVAAERAERVAAGTNPPYDVWAGALTEEVARAEVGGMDARDVVRRALAGADLTPRPPSLRGKGVPTSEALSPSQAPELAEVSARGTPFPRREGGRGVRSAPASARPGVVYLVGAGPGDPDLITVRGRALLASADVIFYDRLAAPELLALARSEAERVFVGKHGGGVYRPQAEINRLLIEAAGRGAVVVRLKGGDPFVFGRGGEECAALAAAGVPFVVVPGVSAAVAVPAAAGIPVTHRDFGSAFAVITGHEDPARANSRLDWAALARMDTLVVLMGVSRLPAIASALLDHGMPPETPAALVRRGTLPDQEVVTGTLADIAARAQAAALKPPATLVLGAVVRLRERLAAAAVGAAEQVAVFTGS